MKYLVILMILLMSITSQAQDKVRVGQIGVYDPSFWKKELRLDNFQYRRMCEINLEFYERLVAAYHSMKDDRPAFRSAFAECWVNRNTQLLQTMNIRQQKKWKRIMEYKYNGANAQASAFNENSNLQFLTSTNDSYWLLNDVNW